MAGLGLHHVTAISGPARRTLDFYGRVLGLRLVKKTVNFDDPGTYHLYFGDEGGSPGSILTFFPWEHAAPGRLGIGTTERTLFRVPEGSIGFWTQRLLVEGVAHEQPVRRFGQTVLAFKDPDGLSLGLVGVSGAATEPGFASAEIAAADAIRGFAGVALLIEAAEPTAAILVDVFGYEEIGREDGIIRLEAKAGMGGIVDLHAAGPFLPARLGAGSVHHIAFRAADDAAQAAMADRLRQRHGLLTTEQKDRNYFRSVYFREPGGVLFEIATDAPGFAVDEDQASLGEALKLPPFLEPYRRSIEANLPDLGPTTTKEVA
ncbi:glyoxalase family protein [Arboricoccus pini]|uniref:Glyoxalase family protein n=1 Tax=Arboricoccus pini TaxID=1963835 RepID=A0A212RS38_9PROT|nr:ring-cleaving dioxygenase [Arboricoccus pini]SNB75455.1 glyoxalase family protein [Arboricoccus pini]